MEPEEGCCTPTPSAGEAGGQELQSTPGTQSPEVTGVLTNFSTHTAANRSSPQARHGTGTREGKHLMQLPGRRAEVPRITDQMPTDPRCTPQESHSTSRRLTTKAAQRWQRPQLYSKQTLAPWDQHRDSAPTAPW